MSRCSLSVPNARHLEQTVGILGGVGPLATVVLMEQIIQWTDAHTDQEHLNMIVLNHATIPDRTAYILGKSDQNPAHMLVQDAKTLEQYGASLIALPCNTAHYCHQAIQTQVTIPVIHMIAETVTYIETMRRHPKTVGLLATDGTIAAQVYQIECEKRGIQCMLPRKQQQQEVMELIYGQVKAGRRIDIQTFLGIVAYLREAGCEAVILGCTELSVIRRDFQIQRSDMIDSLEVLARRVIQLAGKRVVGHGKRSDDAFR